MSLKGKLGLSNRLGLSPARIAILYTVFSIVWIAFSDIVVNDIADPQRRLYLTTSKGFVFVVITALMLYFLVKKLVAQMREAQRSLASSEAEYHGLIQATNEGICRLNKDDLIGFVNPRMSALLKRGAEELIGQPLSSFLDERDRPAFAAQMDRWRAGAIEQHDFRFRGADGSDIWAIVSGTPMFVPEKSYSGCFLMLMDVTERQRIQQQLQHSQKLEAVGRFAGGIAHDFNNVLGIIVGYTSLLKSDLEGNEASQEYADFVLRSCDRAAALVKQLLAFSRKQPFQISVVDLNDTVSNFGKMLPRVLGEDIRITIRTSVDAALVRTDPVQIEQVLMNLSLNARDAMPNGGTLLIETGRVEHGALGLLDAGPGLYSFLRVTDSGIGMNAETKSRIFEPFFTTKGVGKGTGLGLSMVYGIVKQSGGFLEVASELQKGTTFSIYFPEADATPQSPLAPERATSATRRGSETILLVEDEPDLRLVTKHILTQHGYRVIEAEDGMNALAVCHDRIEAIDLVITDLVMPQMGGRELASRLAVLKPSLKVVFITGYAEGSGEDLADCIAIEKPISPEVLVKRIRQILDDNSPQARAC